MEEHRFAQKRHDRDLHGVLQSCKDREASHQKRHVQKDAGRGHRMGHVREAKVLRYRSSFDRGKERTAQIKSALSYRDRRGSFLKKTAQLVRTAASFWKKDRSHPHPRTVGNFK